MVECESEPEQPAILMMVQPHGSIGSFAAFVQQSPQPRPRDDDDKNWWMGQTISVHLSKVLALPWQPHFSPKTVLKPSSSSFALPPRHHVIICHLLAYPPG